MSEQCRLLSDFMNNIPDAIYFKDKQGKFIFVNNAYTKGLASNPEQLTGKTDFDIFPQKLARQMAKDDLYVLATGESILDKIEKVARPDGSDSYISITKIPRHDDKGKIIGLMGMTRDVTKRMRYERIREERLSKEEKLGMLEDLNRIRTEFISAVSHELRTPLAIINQLLLLIYDETAGPLNDKQREILVKVRYNIDRQKNIIDKMLDISRIEGKKLSFRYALVNINDLLKDSKDFFTNLAAEKNIKLSYDLPDNDINIFIDAERIIQIVTNLINNAIKFTEENGEIKVEVKLLEDKVRIGVIDTGVGIAKSDLPKVFDKFVQVSQSDAARKQGIGLGLTIVKELVEKHGGEIWIESEPGVGSKFYFTLPRFYTANILGSRVKAKINQLLKEHKSIYLINLLIVDWETFKKRVDVGPEKLFKELKEIVGLAYEELFGPDTTGRHIVIMDMDKGKCSIVFPQGTQEKVTLFCELLREKTKNYFIQNKIENVFIAMGILSYSAQNVGKNAQAIASNLQIKEIYIGAEMRRSKRIHYKTRIDIIVPGNEKQTSETLDLSRHGACFISRDPLKIDVEIKVHIVLLKKKKTIMAKARVAWLSSMGHQPGEIVEKYKIGLEFIDLSKKDSEFLSSELKLYYE